MLHCHPPARDRQQSFAALVAGIFPILLPMRSEPKWGNAVNDSRIENVDAATAGGGQN
jgi:hypothetical protein